MLQGSHDEAPGWDASITDRKLRGRREWHTYPLCRCTPGTFVWPVTLMNAEGDEKLADYVIFSSVRVTLAQRRSGCAVR